jgi:hypothetical protein
MLEQVMVKMGFLRRWSGTLFAALLVLAVLTPTVDTFVCIDDFGGTVAVAQNQDHPGPSKNFPVQQHDDGDSSCIHGHCHHWVGYQRLGGRLAFASAAGRAAPIMGGYDRPASAPPIEILRPPQA